MFCFKARSEDSTWERDLGEAGWEETKGVVGQCGLGPSLSYFLFSLLLVAPLLHRLGLRDRNKVTSPAEQAQYWTRLGLPIPPTFLPPDIHPKA